VFRHPSGVDASSPLMITQSGDASSLLMIASFSHGYRGKGVVLFLHNGVCLVTAFFEKKRCLSGLREIPQIACVQEEGKISSMDGSAFFPGVSIRHDGLTDVPSDMYPLRV